MSLIITNNTTLKNTAIIVLVNKKNNITEETNGDITLIKSEDQVVGINIFNFEKYFSAKEGAHTLTKDQVDAISKLGYTITDYKSKFSIAEVMNAEQHPKSEKLQLLKLNTTKELKIVTNDLTVSVGEKVVVANLGATLPSGLAIVRSKVMGVESEGMLCGGETLGLEKTDGVMRVSGNNGDEFIL